MKIFNARCPNCGSNLEVDFDDMSAYCYYCHSSVYIDDEIQRVRYEFDEDTGYEFEMGRIRAREEYEAKKRDDA